MDQTPESAKVLPEGLFPALLRQSLDAIVLLERDSRRFLECSDSWCRLTGFTREELLGRTGTELGLIRADERAIINRRLSDGRDGVYEIRMWRNDGRGHMARLLNAENWAES